jgi:hypothetical protein
MSAHVVLSRLSPARVRLSSAPAHRWDERSRPDLGHSSLYGNLGKSIGNSPDFPSGPELSHVGSIMHYGVTSTLEAVLRQVLVDASMTRWDSVFFSPNHFTGDTCQQKP